MRSPTRLAVILAMAAVTLLLAALPALAKGAPGEDPAVHMVMAYGPNMRVPIVFSGPAAMDFARDAGMLQAAQGYSFVGTVASAAPSALGPRFTLTYVFTRDVSAALGRDGEPVTQDLYPYAVGGPWAFTPPGQGLHTSGWWPTASGLVATLRAAGLPAAPASQPRIATSKPTADASAWGLWIALAIVATILVLDFAVAPGRGLTRRSHLVRP